MITKGSFLIMRLRCINCTLITSGMHVSSEDIKEADPCLYSSYKQILAMDADAIDSDDLGLTFIREVKELGSKKVIELCVLVGKASR
ncbi:hypothetical protein SLE2022_321030 [Rubroshorea leprosula]